MQRTICNLFREAIATSGLEWLDVVAGMVEPIQVTTRQGEGSQVATIPAWRYPFRDGCNKGADYVTCIPLTENASLLYMEASNQNNIAHTSRFDEYVLPITLVGWVNLKKINTTYASASECVDELLSIIPKQLPNQSPYNTIRVDVEAVNRDIAVVNRYDINEAENQMWMYPFDFFTINLRITYRRTHVCHGNVIEAPGSCFVY